MKRLFPSVMHLLSWHQGQCHRCGTALIEPLMPCMWSSGQQSRSMTIWMEYWACWILVGWLGCAAIIRAKELVKYFCLQIESPSPTQRSRNSILSYPNIYSEASEGKGNAPWISRARLTKPFTTCFYLLPQPASPLWKSCCSEAMSRKTGSYPGGVH